MSNITLEGKVDHLIEDVAEIRAALKYNGIGLIPSFEQHCNQDREFRADYYKFKRTVFVVTAFVVGSGGLGVGIVKLMEMVG